MLLSSSDTSRTQFRPERTGLKMYATVINFPCISTLFQTINYVRSNNLNLKYQKSKSSGCQDIGIRKLNLWQRLNRLNSFPNISVNFKGKNFVDQILEIPRLLNCDTAELCLQNISHGTKTTSISELVI